eukprot:sb/3462201/
MSEDLSDQKDYNSIQSDLKIRSLHELARNGQFEGLREILDSGTVDVNSLCRTEGLEPLTPLSCAVKNGDVKCIDLLLEYGAELNPSTELDRHARKHPLVCAAECRVQEVIKHLVSKGANVKLAFAVLSNLYDTELCRTLDVRVDLELSEISILELQETPPNLEALSELVDPEVLCASNSPIDMALDLEEACLVAARVCQEHATAFIQLSKQCQTFAKDFLGCCQVASDVEVLMCMKNADNTFARALKYNEKEFLTQPWIHVVCNKQWMGELGSHCSFIKFIVACLKVLLTPILIPFYFIYGVTVGNLSKLNKFIQLLGTPALCFFSFVLSHILFFVILLRICIENTRQEPSSMEKLSWVWLLGKLLADSLKYYKVLRLTSFKVSVFRVVFDIIYLGFFFSLFVLRVYTGSLQTSSTTLTLIFTGDLMYAVGALLHILQFMYILQVTRFLGPLLVSMRYILSPLVKVTISPLSPSYCNNLSCSPLAKVTISPLRYFLWELVRFLAILLILNLSFSIAITKIFSAYTTYEKHVKMSFEEGFHHFTKIATTLFWATFALVDLNAFTDYKSHILASLVIGVYILLSCGLLLMLLVAMINHQYSKAKRRFEMEWRFLSAKLTHEFSLQHPTIIPFNLISLPVSLLAQALVRAFGDNSKLVLFSGKDQVVEPHLVYYIQSKVTLNPDCEEERQNLIQSLVTSYLTQKSWPGINISRRPRVCREDEDPEGADAQSMTSSPTGVVDPTLVVERMSCHLEKQDHAISELRRTNAEIALKLDILLKRVRADSSPSQPPPPPPPLVPTSSES